MCDDELTRGVLPVQAKANGMGLDTEPPKLFECFRAQTNIAESPLYEDDSITQW